MTTAPSPTHENGVDTGIPDDPRVWYRPGVTCMWNRIRRLTPITDRQCEVLAFVVGHIERHGYAPTVREVGNHFGWRSTRTAGEYLHTLARKGALQITPGIARGIRVLDASGAVRPDPGGNAATGRISYPAHERVVDKTEHLSTPQEPDDDQD